MIAPSPVRLKPFVYHTHEWRVIISSIVSKEWPRDMEDEVIAICACGAKMVCEQIEAVLNS